MTLDDVCPAESKTVATRVRSLAFYLPQFHPIPENDEWWGDGFTEWTNVVPATPRFRGHRQPHVPADLGFYDLRVPEVRAAQADLALRFGVSGFCYYHYWFEGRRLLERPFDEVLRSGEPDFPFCLCWANENWTSAWDGKAREILIRQTYSPDDDLAHIRWLGAAFSDRRYIRVGGKPLLLVYRAHHLPDPLRTTECWRAEAERLGLGEIYLCSMQTGPASAHRSRDPRLRRGGSVRSVLQPRSASRSEPARPRCPQVSAGRAALDTPSAVRVFGSDRGSSGRSVAALHALPVRDAGLRQLTASTGPGRDDPHGIDARVVRVVAARSRPKAPAALERREARLRQRVERMGRGQPPRTVPTSGGRGTSKPMLESWSPQPHERAQSSGTSGNRDRKPDAPVARAGDRALPAAVPPHRRER